MALIARMTRASMLGVLGEDYVRTAFAKGLAPRSVLLGHALKAASLPVVTIIGVGFALLIGGAVVTESVFALPGIGRLTVDAIVRRDYPVIQGVILIISGVYVLPQPGHRRPLCRPRPPHPLLTAPRLARAPRRQRRRGSPRRAGRGFIRRQPTMVAGLACLALILAAGLAAPSLGTVDPSSLRPVTRLREPGATSGSAPTSTAATSTRARSTARGSRSWWASRLAGGMAFGILIGLVIGFYRRLDTVVMRVMDGLMAIPAILLALALMALMHGSVRNVIIALVIPEIPRVVRLVRASVLWLREHTMVEAARALGVGTPRILLRYILPALVAPLIVQATYIGASAILFEAYLSFLGAGTPPHIPSWGNIMAEGKTYVQLAFWIILFPGLFLALTVLAVNLVGDGLRDLLHVRG